MSCTHIIPFGVYLLGFTVFSLACYFFFSSRRRHTRFKCDWSSDVCSSDLDVAHVELRDDTAAAALAWRVVESYPDEIAADDALKLAVRIDEPRDWAALAAHLAALYPRVVKFDVGDNLLFERGMLLSRHDRA